MKNEADNYWNRKQFIFDLFRYFLNFVRGVYAYSHSYPMSDHELVFQWDFYSFKQEIFQDKGL